MKKIITKKEKGANRHWKNFLDKNYLGAHNLEEGEELLVTIQKFSGEEQVQGSDGKSSAKPVLYFKEDVPKMILNITNGNTISTLYGTHPENWIGKKIQICAMRVKAFGKEQDALRIRDFKPKEENFTEEAKEKLSAAKTYEEMKEIWASLPISVKTDKDVKTFASQLKAKLQTHEDNK